MKDFTYLPDLTIGNLKDYAMRGQSQKAFDEGMNLQRANHVHNVEVNNISECINYCFMRGKVVPQTRVSESPYDVWVCVSTSTLQVLTGECKCVAGYGESCKHVFALLHFVEQQVSLGLNKTCTSKKQAWQQTLKRSEKVHPPEKLSSISFERPHPENDQHYTKRSRSLFDPRAVNNCNVEIDWEKLRAVSKGTASVLCFKNVMNEDVDAQEKVMSELKPMTLESIACNSSSLQDFNTLLMQQRTEEKISKIENLTKGQNSNSLWFEYRSGVITASIAHQVLCKYRKKNNSPSSIDNLVGKILGYSKPFKTPSTSWGVENEKYARKRYINKSRSGHKHFKCEEAGLKLHPERVMLGASVDGIVSCACCGIGCLEIKCPFSHREKSVEEYVQESDSCLEQTTCNSPKMKYSLKHTHQYYTQVQH